MTDVDNVHFLNDSVAYHEATAQSLEEAAKRVRKGELKVALCTFVTKDGEPMFVTRGHLHTPQECLAASGLLAHHNHLVMNLLDRIMMRVDVTDPAEKKDGEEPDKS